MFLLKAIALAAASASMVVSSAVIDADAAQDIERRANAITVTLSAVEESTVKAVIQNNADTEYSILTAGTFLDTAPVDKATVFKDGEYQQCGLYFQLTVGRRTIEIQRCSTPCQDGWLDCGRLQNPCPRC